MVSGGEAKRLIVHNSVVSSLAAGFVGYVICALVFEGEGDWSGGSYWVEVMVVV